MRPPITQRGFTLIEIILSMVILSLLGAAAASSLSAGALAFSSSADSIHTLARLRYANERLAREIREIRRNPSTPAVYDITTMTATALTFTKTDGTVVSLSAAATQLTMSYSGIAGSHVLTDQVGAFGFDYYQADGSTPATGNTDIAFVEFELILNRSGNNYPQRSRVALRNLQ